MGTAQSLKKFNAPFKGNCSSSNSKWLPLSQYAAILHVYFFLLASRKLGSIFKSFIKPETQQANLQKTKKQTDPLFEINKAGAIR